jgi:hypothetical protein
MTPEERAAANEARMLSEDEANSQLDQGGQEEETSEMSPKP